MVEFQVQAKCPTCGTAISGEGGSEGLCPGCLLELALDDTSLEAELLFEPEEAPTLQLFTQGLSEGDIQGERYRIRSMLGKGGMGEVWRAYDLKLRLDVALKALRSELTVDQHALETLRQEVRTAREVISPNVCRVFDLEEIDGQELISMEYVDGTTLQEILKERGPLELNEAREIASQFLAGLEAIHEAGLVHRDIKPENLMITRTGRVVVMDFGIAKGLGDGKSGMVAGTPAYMSPEQAKGDELDPRSDLFSAGVVLAEMVEPGGMRNFEDRRRVWEGIHQESPEVADTPWTKVITQAIAANREERFKGASALARALEEVTLRAAGDETARPYPGLSAFQQEDAEFFYGRELEVEALWKKLRRPHLLAVIGPSGAGKSSFLRAGLMPTLTDGWQAIIATPGNRPFANLARALAEQLPADPETVDALLRFEDPEVAVELISQWREQHRHGLIILDQFEELFTQNPEETQADFAGLLGVLPLRADVHVLLSMRDDFLMQCHRFEALKPVFSELSPLDPPLGAALRRALVEPALKCGYRFEDEGIVEEMLGEVEGQRGALPLLAFAAAQLWERRDRESGLLTRKTYEQIGGVSGALAQHAEALLDYIGESNTPIVRELLRNLVTARGTRAARDRDELLSVFPEFEGEPFLEPSKVRPKTAEKPERPAAKHVLNSLIDARLLTSYEIPADKESGEPHHRIEIVHESLLARWPRLVRWQRQDEDSAQLRDELRSQARLWDEHGRSEDYLWTGTAFREYELWRERYPGGLTETEEAFARAMTSLAARRKRRRRIVMFTVIAILAIGLTVVVGLWRQADQQRRRAEAETLRAVAGKLIALGEVEFSASPTEALAWATKSLEVADTLEGRMLALRALQEGSPVTVLPMEKGGLQEFWGIGFSPNGEWLASAHYWGVWLRSQNGGETSFHHRYSNTGDVIRVAFESDEVLIADQGGVFRWLSVPGGEELRRVEGDRGRLHWPRDGGYFTHSERDGQGLLHRWPFEEGTARLLGTMADWQVADIYQSHVGSERPMGANWSAVDIDESGSWMAYSRNRTIYLRSLENWHQSPRRIGSHEVEVVELVLDAEGERVAAKDDSGELRIWSTAGSQADPPRILEAEGYYQIHFDPSGQWLGAHQAAGGGDIGVRLWDLNAPAAAEPLTMGRTDDIFSLQVLFHPTRSWMVTSNLNSAGFWPLPNRQPWVLRGHVGRVYDVAFTPDGEWLISSAGDGVRAWPLLGQNGGAFRILVDRLLIGFAGIDIQPSGDYLAVTSREGDVLLVPLAGGPIRELGTVFAGEGGMSVTFSPDGRFLAALPYFAPPEEMVIRVWDLESGEVSNLGPVPGWNDYLGFDDNQRLRWSGMPLPGAEAVAPGGERVFDLENGSMEIVEEEATEATGHRLAVSSREDFALVTSGVGSGSGIEGWDLFWKSLESGELRRITSHGPDESIHDLAIDPSDQWMVTAGGDPIVRVGPVTGEEPHLLFGHTGLIRDVEFSPDGRWIASGGDDGTVRLWPTPDLSKPPLHTLSHDELIAKLHSLTNLRVVEDPEAATGWKLDYAPFPGWKEVPEW